MTTFLARMMGAEPARPGPRGARTLSLGPATPIGQRAFTGEAVGRSRTVADLNHRIANADA